MSKQQFRLAHAEARRRAAQACQTAPHGYVVTIAPATRSIEQNALMWSCLTDIARDVIWHGQKLTPEDFKCMLTASLKQQRVVPGVEGGFVVLGQSTSRMSKSELSELVELAHAFGTEKGVNWSPTSLGGFHGE